MHESIQDGTRFLSIEPQWKLPWNSNPPPAPLTHIPLNNIDSGEEWKIVGMCVVNSKEPMNALSKLKVTSNKSIFRMMSISFRMSFFHYIHSLHINSEWDTFLSCLIISSCCTKFAVSLSLFPSLKHLMKLIEILLFKFIDRFLGALFEISWMIWTGISEPNFLFIVHIIRKSVLKWGLPMNRL